MSKRRKTRPAHAAILNPTNTCARVRIVTSSLQEIRSPHETINKPICIYISRDRFRTFTLFPLFSRSSSIDISYVKKSAVTQSHLVRRGRKSRRRNVRRLFPIKRNLFKSYTDGRGYRRQRATLSWHFTEITRKSHVTEDASCNPQVTQRNSAGYLGQCK